MEFKQKLNPQTGVFNLIPKNEIINFKAGVPTAANLPLIGNSTNDARITNDTGHLYIWNGATWIDEGDIIDLTWEAISGKPSSTPANIDDAVSKRHSNSLDHTASSQFNQLISGEITGLTNKDIPLDADVTLIESDADTNAKRKLSWLNIKNTLKTYFDTLYTITNLGGVAVISTNTTLTVKASGGDFTTIQAALDSLNSKRINSDVTVTISVDPGLFTHTSAILFRHPQGNRINLVGATPVTTTLTSLVSFSGTTGNYSVTLNVANTSGMAIGDYCIIRGSTGTGEYRAVMGCWEITNIPSGTQIVVKNTYRKTVAPTLTITGGSLHCLKTILKFNNCDGILPGNSTGYIYNLALVGNGSSNDGVNISQRGYNYGNHVIYLGEPGASYSLGINGFGRYGVANTSKAEVWMISAAVSNCGSYGIYSYNQSQIAGSGIISSGNGSIGIYATDGAFITAVSSFAIGNGTAGFYAFNRAGMNVELSESVGNVYSGFQCLGTSYIYAKTSKAINNGYHGYSSSYNGMIYAQSSVATGNGAAINYYGYWSSNGGHIRADSTTASGNFSGDYLAEHFSFIKVTSYIGSPTFSPAVDTMGNGGAIIRNVVATALKIADTIKNTPAGNISSTDVQAAINELDTEKTTLSEVKADVDIDDAIDKKHASGSDNQTASEISTTESGLSVQDKLDTIVVPPFAQSLITGLVNDLKNLSLNVVLNAFRIAIQGSLSLLHMVDSFVDEYEDESGVDTGASTFEVYDAVNDLYSPVIVPPSEDIDILTGGTATAETYDGGGYEANKGVDDNITTRWTAYGNVSRWWKYDLGAGVTKKVTKLKIITTMGLYKDFTLHGSNNDSDWTLIYTGQQANNDNWQEFTFSNTTAYRYYKLTSSSNWRGDTYIGFYEVEMMESILPGYVEDMTLISNPQTADDTPLTARLVIFEEDVDSITLNTDLKGWVSRDGGSTFSQITLVEESLYDAPARILSGEVDISGQPSGTSMVYKLNSYAKDLKIHGTGLLWN